MPPSAITRLPPWARRWAPWVAIAAVVAYNLWGLWAETMPVSYLNDSSVHEEMTRFAASRIAHGHLPFTSWFPFTVLGSAQYLHYQSLGSVLVGAVGAVVGASTAFSWSTYLLLSLWPVVIYASARLFGLTRTAASVAAVASPFMVSYTGVGYERGAYIWIGGAQVWTQLLGSWALPFAWAFTFRSFQRARWAWPACALVATTTALHFLSGYLGFLGIAVLALVADGPLRHRLARAAVLFGGSLAAAAWVVVPLVTLSKWSSINQELAITNYVQGYGARTVLGWLFKGQMFDARRAVPVLTVFVLAGALICITKWLKGAHYRALVALFTACLLLTFGPTTWGPLTDLVPAHADLYFRRFMMGSQLAGVYMAGTGAQYAWAGACWLSRRFLHRARVRRLAWGLAALALVAWCSPAVLEISRLDQRDAATIAAQRQADTTQGAALAPLLAYVKSHPEGRTYAGMGSNWGQSFTIGFVPIYKYLEREDVDEDTYVVPSLSLMLDPEAGFDENNPADFSLFGTPYLLLPVGVSAPVPAKLLMASGSYALWQVPGVGYATTVNAVGVLQADRADIGSRSLGLLASLGPHQDMLVDWPGLPPPSWSPGPPASGAPGSVSDFVDQLADGRASVRVDMKRAGQLLVAVAFDPGWHAWANGKPVPTEMLAPALLGLELGPGKYTIVLRYQGYRWYPELWAFGLLSLVGVAWADRRMWGRPGYGTGAGPVTPVAPVPASPSPAPGASPAPASGSPVPAPGSPVPGGSSARATAACMAIPASIGSSSITMRFEWLGSGRATPGGAAPRKAMQPGTSRSTNDQSSAPISGVGMS